MTTEIPEKKFAAQTEENTNKIWVPVCGIGLSKPGKCIGETLVITLNEGGDDDSPEYGTAWCKVTSVYANSKRNKYRLQLEDNLLCLLYIEYQAEMNSWIGYHGKHKGNIVVDVSVDA